MDADEEDADGGTGLPEQLEVQRTRMIVGPELNYHVRLLVCKHGHSGALNPAAWYKSIERSGACHCCHNALQRNL